MYVQSAEYTKNAERAREERQGGGGRDQREAEEKASIRIHTSGRSKQGMIERKIVERLTRKMRIGFGTRNTQGEQKHATATPGALQKAPSQQRRQNLRVVKKGQAHAHSH